jgi:hypothetical protein
MELSKIPYKTLNNFLNQTFLKIKHNKDIEILQQYYHNKSKIHRKNSHYTYKEDTYIIEFKSGNNHILVIRPIKKNITDLIDGLMFQYHHWFNKYQYAYTKYIQGNKTEHIISTLNISVVYIKNIKKNINLLEQYLIDINSEITNKINKLKEENLKLDDELSNFYSKFSIGEDKKINPLYFEKLKQKKINENIILNNTDNFANYLVLQPAMLYKIK